MNSVLPPEQASTELEAAVDGVRTAVGHLIKVVDDSALTDLLEGVAREIAKFFKGGPVPVTPAETLEIFALMQAAEESKASGGAPVKLHVLDAL